MNWKLIALLSLSGVLMGTITLFIIPGKYEAFLAMPLFLVSAYFIARHAQVAYFLHGALSGIIHSIITTIIHVIKSDLYLSHHPKDAALYVKMGQESSATVSQVMLVLGVFSMVISAVTLGFFSAAGSRILKALAGEK